MKKIKLPNGQEKEIPEAQLEKRIKQLSENIKRTEERLPILKKRLEYLKEVYNEGAN